MSSTRLNPCTCTKFIHTTHKQISISFKYLPFCMNYWHCCCRFSMDTDRCGGRMADFINRFPFPSGYRGERWCRNLKGKYLQPIVQAIPRQPLLPAMPICTCHSHQNAYRVKLLLCVYVYILLTG